MKRLISLLCLLLCISTFSQTTCEQKSKDVNELDILSLKRCGIERSNKQKTNITKQSKTLTNRTVVVKKSTAKRFLTIRALKEREEVLSLHNSITSSGLLKNETEDMEFETMLAFPKDYNNVETFETVDKIPVFKSCKKASGDDLSACFNNKIISFVNNNITYPKSAIEEHKTGLVAVKFIFDKNGEINNIRVTGDKEIHAFQKDVLDLIHKMPKFQPATKNNEEVSVEFEFLLNFTFR